MKSQNPHTNSADVLHVHRVKHGTGCHQAENFGLDVRGAQHEMSAELVCGLQTPLRLQSAQYLGERVRTLGDNEDALARE
jgi:hypothetical protein